MCEQQSGSDKQEEEYILPFKCLGSILFLRKEMSAFIQEGGIKLTKSGSKDKIMLQNNPALNKCFSSEAQYK